MKMITRFSLYGFLKNFNFAEPFMILFYLSLDFSFFEIGILVSFLNICINVLELPSGAFADLYGRKTSMLVSLISYVISYALFAISSSFAPILLALFFFSIGDAFRTGTHKAIIFDWLKTHDRLGEKTKVYGFTRSWSNYGSAISVLIAALIVITTKDYRLVFLLSMIPGLLGVWNMACYPSELNRRKEGEIPLSHVLVHTKDVLIKTIKHTEIRLLILQNMAFESCFDISKNYLQPILQAQAIVLTAYITLPEQQSTAIVVGLVYFILHMISASSSRSSHKFAAKFATERSALIFLIFLASFLTFASSLGLVLKIFIISIIMYTVYYIIHNLWVPILVAQYDDYADSSEQATVLSIASQAKTIGIAILAPIAGFFADKFGIQSSVLLLSLLLLVLGFISLIHQKKTA